MSVKGRSDSDINSAAAAIFQRPVYHLCYCQRCKHCDLPSYEKSANLDECFHHWCVSRQREECLICYEVPAQAYRPRCCDKQFCRDCFVTWLKKHTDSPTCPHCRAPMNDVYQRIVKYEKEQAASRKRQREEAVQVVASAATPSIAQAEPSPGPPIPPKMIRRSAAVAATPTLVAH